MTKNNNYKNRNPYKPLQEQIRKQVKEQTAREDTSYAEIGKGCWQMLIEGLIYVILVCGTCYIIRGLVSGF